MTKSDGKDTTVIATDSSLNAVLFIDSETGKVETVVHMNGKSPQGITMDTNGNFYVCSFNSNEVILLSADLSEQKVLLSKKDKLRGLPQAIAYDKNKHCLMLSYMNSDFIGVYKLS